MTQRRLDPKDRQRTDAPPDGGGENRKGWYQRLKTRLAYARFRFAQSRQMRKARKQDRNIYPLY
jgi:hypothetical protein